MKTKSIALAFGLITATAQNSFALTLADVESECGGGNGTCVGMVVMFIAERTAIGDLNDERLGITVARLGTLAQTSRNPKEIAQAMRVAAMYARTPELAASIRQAAATVDAMGTPNAPPTFNTAATTVNNVNTGTSASAE